MIKRGVFFCRSISEELAKQELFLDNLHEQMKQEDGNEVCSRFSTFSVINFLCGVYSQVKDEALTYMMSLQRKHSRVLLTIVL